MMVAIEYGSMPNPTVHYMVPRTGKVIALRSGHLGLLTHPHQKSNRQGPTPLLKPCLGVEKILEQKHSDRPRSVARSSRFKILCFNEERKKELLESYREFVGRYREMWDGFRKAAAKGPRPKVEWPDWSYPPSCWQSIALPAT